MNQRVYVVLFKSERGATDRTLNKVFDAPKYMVKRYVVHALKALGATRVRWEGDVAWGYETTRTPLPMLRAEMEMHTLRGRDDELLVP